MLALSGAALRVLMRPSALGALLVQILHTIAGVPSFANRPGDRMLDCMLNVHCSSQNQCVRVGKFGGPTLEWFFARVVTPRSLGIVLYIEEASRQLVGTGSHDTFHIEE